MDIEVAEARLEFLYAKLLGAWNGSRFDTTAITPDEIDEINALRHDIAEWYAKGGFRP